LHQFGEWPVVSAPSSSATSPAGAQNQASLAGLTWRALDLDNARLSVERQLVPTRGGCTFGPPKSAQSRRTVALDPATVDMLGTHRETQLLERHFAGRAYVDGDLVFADALGGPSQPQRLTEWFSEHRKAAGIVTGSLHTLRHTAATLALTSGVPVHIVAARLGDSPTEILKTNAHLLPQSSPEAPRPRRRRAARATTRRVRLLTRDVVSASLANGPRTPPQSQVS
jgi:integrase